MHNLFLFFRRHYFFFLFLLLEVISLILFFRYNTFQQKVFFNWTNDFSGSLIHVYDDVAGYFNLRQKNFLLSEENARLHARMPEAIYISDYQIYSKEDTILQQEYRYIPAKVISNSTNKRNNYLMISKGSLQGIKPHMGVVFNDKLVGQVVSVSPHFSWIISFLHQQSRISAKFLHSNQLVTVEWPGIDYTTGLAREIPKHLIIRRGDTIVTSGNSEVYPEGLLIGTIEENLGKPEESFNRASVKLLTDFNGLDYVEVVVDLFQDEKQTLRDSFKEK